NVSARPRNGLTFQGGVNSGSTHTDYCAVRAQIPEWTSLLVGQSPTNPYCKSSTGLITRYTGLASYTIPKVDVLLSGTFRSDQGTPLAANWTITNSSTDAIARAAWNQIIQSLGRPLSNNATSVTINLVPPGTVYGDRVNEFDIRLAKILRVGRTRTNIG